MEILFLIIIGSWIAMTLIVWFMYLMPVDSDEDQE